MSTMDAQDLFASGSKISKQCKYSNASDKLSVTFNPRSFKIILSQAAATLSVLPWSYVSCFDVILILVLKFLLFNFRLF